MNSNNSHRIAFVHPDLGIGGAERLVVDAAVALEKQGNAVHIYTSHCDADHCFEEVKGLSVTVWGDWIPRSLFGKFHVVFALLRMLWVSFWLVFGGHEFDVVFVDQVSYCIPLLKLSGAKILFYCHFPDKLLSQPGSFLKKLYRMPLDFVEEQTTRLADVIITNSKFTSSIVKEHFPSIKQDLRVLYPTTFLEKSPEKTQKKSERFFLSINRYERKKNLELAVDAFVELRKSVEDPNSLKLVLVGGYDERVDENIQVFEELSSMVKSEGLNDQIELLRSVNKEKKMELLENCLALIYTPHNEHFGIVPLEAMALGKPVIASNSGGPMETIEDNVTGFLCKEDTAQSFADAMRKLVSDSQRAEKMGNAGAKRLKAMFGPKVFEKKLSDLINESMESKKKK